MIKKENIRITVTVPKYVIEELKRKYNYNTILLARTVGCKIKVKFFTQTA